MSANRSRPSTPRKRKGKNAPLGLSGRTIVLGGVLLVVIVAAIIALASAGGDDSDSASGATQETASVEVEGTSLPSFPGNGKADDAVGDTAPTLVGETFDKSPITVTSNGTPQAIVFLSHSCPHCQAEVPRIVEAADADTFDGIDVSAVATNTSDQLPNYPPSAWLEDEGWPFPVLLDDEDGTAGRAYGLTAFPYFVFVDADGTVVGRATGEANPAQMKAIADALRNGKELPLTSGDGGSSSAS